MVPPCLAEIEIWELVVLSQQLLDLPVSAEQIRQQTEKDPVLPLWYSSWSKGGLPRWTKIPCSCHSSREALNCHYSKVVSSGDLVWLYQVCTERLFWLNSMRAPWHSVDEGTGKILCLMAWHHWWHCPFVYRVPDDTSYTNPCSFASLELAHSPVG